MKKTTIIFDFDGTIADSIPFILKAAHELAKKYDFTPPPEEEIDSFKDKPPMEIIKRLKIPLYKVPFLIVEGQQLLHKYMKNVGYVKGMRKVLESLHTKGYTLGLLTSNSKENVEIFLHKQDLRVFDFVYSERSLFGKAPVLEKMMRKFSLKKEEVMYVGDEVRDVDACKKAHVDVVSVTWGFSSKPILKEHGPNHIVDKPEELLKLFV